jgi:hypothetical protein
VSSKVEFSGFISFDFLGLARIVMFFFCFNPENVFLAEMGVFTLLFERIRDGFVLWGVILEVREILCGVLIGWRLGCFFFFKKIIFDF